MNILNPIEQFEHNIIKLIPELPDHIAIAVSGGSDSMALLSLAHKWAREGGVKLSILTVDHHLRKESRMEAEYVGKICSELQLLHQILDWNHEGIKSNMQARARKGRYDLMTDWCHKHNIKMLFTAHHLDDQIENFFIRLSRASGLFGLLDHSIGLYNRINIFRPLYNIPKSLLQTYLVKHGIDWCEDQSNEDSKYQRNNIRKWLQAMPPELNPELFKVRILQTQQHLRQAADYIKEDIDKDINDNVFFNDEIAEYDLNKDKLIAQATLSYLLKHISGQLREIRAESLIKIYEHVLVSEKTITLHGCLIKKNGNGKIIIKKEGLRHNNY